MIAVFILLFIGKLLLWLVAIVAGLTLLALVLTLAVLLLVPVSLKGRVEPDVQPDPESDLGVRATSRWQGAVRHGGFLFRMEARGTGRKVEEAFISVCGFRIKPAADRKQRRRKQLRRTWRPTWAEIKAMGQEGPELARRLLAALHLHVAGDVVFGFGDPAITGMVLGVLSMARLPGGLRYEPDWLDPRLQGWIELRGRAYGIQIASLLLHAFWRSPWGERLRNRMRTWFTRQKVQAGGRA